MGAKWPGTLFLLFIAVALIRETINGGGHSAPAKRDSDDILTNAEFLAKNPQYPAAILKLIRAHGLTCPTLGILWDRGLSPLGDQLEALCAIDADGKKINTALHYAVYPSRLAVNICQPYEAFGAACE